MMIRNVLGCCVMAGVLTVLTTAQQKDVLAIDEMYREVRSDIEYEAMQEARASLSTIVPGIGPRTVSVGYAFVQKSVSEEDAEAWTPHIRLAWASYTIAASLSVHVEYLFDAEGACVLCVQKTEGAECGERRYYMREGDLIGIEEGTFDTACEDGVDTIIPERERFKEFSDTEKKTAAEMLLRAARYVRAFPLIASSAQIEFGRQ